MAIAIEPSDHVEYQAWYNQIQIGITVCNDMAQFSPVGLKTKHLLEQLFLAAVDASSSDLHYQLNTHFQLPMHGVMGLFADEFDPFDGHSVLTQFDPDAVSYTEDQFPMQQYPPYV
jgi:hypothetical protein